MDKHIYNDQTGMGYTLQGDYYLPDILPPDKEKEIEIGLWGQRHKRYLKEHHKVRYYNLLTAGTLDSYLADIDKQAEDMFNMLVKQMAEREGVTEQMKADNQLEWVKRMNNIRCRATDVVNTDIIFA